MSKLKTKTANWWTNLPFIGFLISVALLNYGRVRRTVITGTRLEGESLVGEKERGQKGE